MKRFVMGVDRSQTTLLLGRLEDFFAEDNPAPAISAPIEAQDLRGSGFKGFDLCAAGRPVYYRAVLLKLYRYGYRNRIPSSRRIERQSQRHVELMKHQGTFHSSAVDHVLRRAGEMQSRCP